MEDKVNISSSTTDNTKSLQYLAHNEQEINQQTIEPFDFFNLPTEIQVNILAKVNPQEINYMRLVCSKMNCRIVKNRRYLARNKIKFIGVSKYAVHRFCKNNMTRFPEISFSEFFSHLSWCHILTIRFFSVKITENLCKELDSIFRDESVKCDRLLFYTCQFETKSSLISFDKLMTFLSSKISCLEVDFCEDFQFEEELFSLLFIKQLRGLSMYNGHAFTNEFLIKSKYESLHLEKSVISEDALRQILKEWFEGKRIIHYYMIQRKNGPGFLDGERLLKGFPNVHREEQNRWELTNDKGETKKLYISSYVFEFAPYIFPRS